MIINYILFWRANEKDYNDELIIFFLRRWYYFPKLLLPRFPRFSICSELYSTIAMAEIALGEEYICIYQSIAALPEHGNKLGKAQHHASRIKRIRECGFVFKNVVPNERLRRS